MGTRCPTQVAFHISAEKRLFTQWHRTIGFLHGENIRNRNLISHPTQKNLFLYDSRKIFPLGNGTFLSNGLNYGPKILNQDKRNYL